jgi:hypothetical protein
MLGRPDPVEIVQRPEPPPAVPAPPARPVMQEISAAIAEATNLLRSAAMTQPAAPATAPQQALPAKPLPMGRPVATTAALQNPSGVPAAAGATLPEMPAVQHAAVRELAPEAMPAAIPAPPTAPTRVEPVALAAPAREPAAVVPPAQVAPAPRSSPASAVQPPSLTDVQPLLTQLLERMESGSGEQMLRLLSADARGTASAQSLVRHYDGLVRGARRVRLAQVEFSSEPRGSVLFVTSRVRLHPGEPTVGSFGERFAVRAEFAARDGRVVLTSLSGVGD